MFHSQQHLQGPPLPVAQQVRRDGSLVTRPLLEESSRIKIRSLITEDIPEIVLAVVEALPQLGLGTANPVYSRGKRGTSRPVSQRTRSQESRSGQSSRRRDRCNQEVSTDNAEREENSNEDSDNEDFGKSNRLCYMHLVITVLITYMSILFKAHCYVTIACFI